MKGEEKRGGGGEGEEGVCSRVLMEEVNSAPVSLQLSVSLLSCRIPIVSSADVGCAEARVGL